MDVILLFALVIGLMLIGVPIAISLGLSSMIFLLVYSDGSLASIAQTLFSAFDGHYTLLAIPFFILASSFMSTGGVAKRIIRFAKQKNLQRALFVMRVRLAFLFHLLSSWLFTLLQRMCQWAVCSLLAYFQDCLQVSC